jgi:triosephosphate isomerase (TIM)
MAKPILVGNWKNYPASPKEAAELLASLGRKAALLRKLSTFIAPPYVYFEPAAKKAKTFGQLASQDIFFAAEGTHTGSITPEILKAFGVKLAIIGHSERRRLGETSGAVAKKIRGALSSGITPLICVGEETRDDEGNHLEVVREELKASLEGIKKDEAKKLVIAYEPVWAIGKRASEAMGPADLSEMVIFIKKVLTDVFGREAAEAIPVLYGGSVDATNAEAIYRGTGVRGFLLGRASLDAKAFAEIAKILISQ